MREYEVTYLIDPLLQEDTRDELNAAVDSKIAEVSGVLTSTTPSLRRNLGYTIRTARAAFVRTLNITITPDHIHDVRTYLQKAKGVLRFQILNTPKRQDVPADVVAKAMQKEKRGVPVKKETEREKKPVTMAEVEKGIEKALSEDVT